MSPVHSTLTLASYLAEFVAETLRTACTSQGAPLTDEENTDLLGANFHPVAACGIWTQYKCRRGRKRPCSGVKIMVKQRQTRTQAPVVKHSVCL